ncbi:MAG: PH domain-containing protein [Nostocoides sp.]
MTGEDVPTISREAFERLLATGERVVFARRQHPIVLWRQSVLAAGGILFVLIAVFGPNRPLYSSSLSIGFWFILAIILWWLYHYLEWRRQWFGVTTKRIVFLAGLLDTDIQMMPLSKLTDMTFKKTWIGDRLGYSHFIVESAGQTQALERLRFIPNAQRARELLTNLLFGYYPAPVRLAGPTPLEVTWQGHPDDDDGTGSGPLGPGGPPSPPTDGSEPSIEGRNDATLAGERAPHELFLDDQPDVPRAGVAPTPRTTRPARDDHAADSDRRDDPGSSDPSGGPEMAWQVSRDQGETIYSSAAATWSRHTADTGPIPLTDHPHPR